MRKYGESGILLSVVCNRCGKKLAVKEGILREGAAHFDVAWDYFSQEKPGLSIKKTGKQLRELIGIENP